MVLQITCIPGHISLDSLRIGSGSRLPHWRYRYSIFSGHFDYPEAQGQMCLEVEMP